MKKASISETKNNLSALIDLVRSGETVLITDRNCPVARLKPVTSGENIDDEARIAKLERAGLIRRAKNPNGMKEFLKNWKPVKLPPGVSALKALLAEREEGW